MNARKNNGYVLSPKNAKPLALELEQVPEEVKKHFQAVVERKTDTVSIGYPALADTPRNQKPETLINNQKPETRNQADAGQEAGHHAMTYLSDPQDDEVARLAEELHVSPEVVRNDMAIAHDWLLEKGVTRKDYRAFLRNWVRRSIQRGTATETKKPLAPRDDLPVSHDDLYNQAVAKKRAFDDDIEQKLAAARQRSTTI